jgi:hypothetical protein
MKVLLRPQTTSLPQVPDQTQTGVMMEAQAARELSLAPPVSVRETDHRNDQCWRHLQFFLRYDQVLALDSQQPR